MFELPEDLSQQKDQERTEWLKGLRNSDVIVFGADICGLTAGLVLQENGKNVLILDEAEELGGRLFWEIGPVPILSPVDELIEELGFNFSSNPPVWLDPVDLLDFFINRFLQAGGRVVPGAYWEDGPHKKSDNYEIQIDLNFKRERLKSGDLIVSMPRAEVEKWELKQAGNPMEEMVKRTGRRYDDGWIQAGYQSLEGSKRDLDFPFVNSLILSGRKAAELVLTGAEGH